MKKKHIKKQLKKIIENEPNSLKAYAANEALDHEDIKTFFLDLQ